MARKPVVQFIVLLGLALSFVVLLSFVNTNPPAPKKAVAEEHLQGPSAEEQMKALVKGLLDSDLRRFQILENNLMGSTGTAQRLKSYEQLVAFWKELDEPLPAAWFTRQSAELNSDITKMSEAGSYFLMASRKHHDRASQVVLANEARKCFDVVLKKDPNHVNSLLGIGEYYVTASTQPMEGIGKIKKVLEINPKNTDALIMLGEFNVMNGSLDKAASRFEEALKVDPSLYAINYRLGELYLKQGDKNKAIEYFENYGSNIKDEFDKSQFDQYISRIKNQ